MKKENEGLREFFKEAKKCRFIDVLQYKIDELTVFEDDVKYYKNLYRSFEVFKEVVEKYFKFDFSNISNPFFIASELAKFCKYLSIDTYKSLVVACESEFYWDKSYIQSMIGYYRILAENETKAIEKLYEDLYCGCGKYKFEIGDKIMLLYPKI